MKYKKEKNLVEKLFKMADIEIGGNSRPWDIQVHNEKFYPRVISNRSLGLGESYMDGWWDCNQVDEFVNKILTAKLDRKIKGLISPSLIMSIIRVGFFNVQNKIGSKKVIDVHYDIGNDFYEKMLDETLSYTCGYWKDADNLKDAQEAKMDLICKKIGLKPGMKILDIGCGWGNFVKYASEKYGVKAVGITISEEQKKKATEDTKGLDVEIRMCDYRDVDEDEKFDAIISIGMFEHVGRRNYREYMEVAHKNLKERGIFMLHCIGLADSSRKQHDPWIEKYIFPNSELPAQIDVTKSVDGLFVIEDWHNFGSDYDKTLVEWYNNFDEHWPEFKEIYGDRFYRMWKYYLLLCAGIFRSRHGQLWQVTLSKDGIIGGHQSVR
jgi:cyclopropane-fatty-acyl-phospholipid synthase